MLRWPSGSPCIASRRRPRQIFHHDEFDAARCVIVLDRFAAQQLQRRRHPQRVGVQIDNVGVDDDGLGGRGDQRRLRRQGCGESAAAATCTAASGGPTRSRGEKVVLFHRYGNPKHIFAAVVADKVAADFTAVDTDAVVAFIGAVVANDFTLVTTAVTVNGAVLSRVFNIDAAAAVAVTFPVCQ